MQLRAPAILVASRPHGETAAIARFLTESHGLVAGYVAGGRGRVLRPVLIPGNRVALDLRARSASQLPFAKVELVESRAPLLGEPLPAAAIEWCCALTAAALPERQPYPSVHDACDGLLSAIAAAPSARGWAGALVGYELLVLRELGFGGRVARPDPADWSRFLADLDRLEAPLREYLLGERREDLLAARARLRARLAQIGA
ncbi:recombination protein O N-terminal domain-containing protein [Blastomonas marina]|uniref:DNA repair protein RecO n=1 Tax=Blastomonas marina TaxID=1867408 RepID=UPI002AC9A3A1|nr:recombination protein O N-terminal domain-containing protein [Blastomonas marina]WPZ02686.1 recombination protein O N-terminal domain-containing protein [Blastomonas marina]